MSRSAQDTTHTRQPSWGQRLREAGRIPYVWGLVAIVLLLLLNLSQNPGYLAITTNPVTGNYAGNLLDIARAAAPILMIAVGMTLVVATKGIDLSVGSVMAVSGAVSMEFLQANGDSVGAMFGAVGLSVLVGLTLGVFSGVLVSTVGLQPFITTLVMMLAGRGLAKVITSGQNSTASNDSFRWLANGYVFGLPVVPVLAVGIVVAVALVVRRTALGMIIEAIGINPRASRMAGIRPRGLLITVYALSAALASVAGIFATASVMTVDVSQTGYQMELDAILAVVIGGTSLAGGTFSLRGAAVGAVLIATLDKTVVFLGVPSSATPAFKAAVIIALCLLQSQRVRGWLRRRRVADSSDRQPPPEHRGIPRAGGDPAGDQPADHTEPAPRSAPTATSTGVPR